MKRIFLIVLLALAPVLSHAAGEERVFGDQPIPVSDSLADLQLYTEEKRLGEPDPFRVFEGNVRLGRWEILGLPSRSGDESETFYLVRVPFTLDLQQRARKFNELKLKIGFATAGAIAFDLFPAEIASTADQVFTVSPTLRFSREREPRVTEIFRLVNLRPRSRAFGSDQALFYWRYHSVGDQGIANGDHHVFFILAVRTGTASLAGRVSIIARVAKERFRIWTDKQTLITSIPVHLDLGEAVIAPGGSPDVRSSTTAESLTGGDH